jgi:hypothetical protein
MTDAALPSFRDETEVIIYNEVNGDNMGTIRAGATSAIRTLHICNNKGGSSDRLTMRDAELTVVTMNDEDSGGEIEEGKEAVEQRMIAAKSNTNNDENFTPIGGGATLTLGDIRGSKMPTPTGIVGEVNHEGGALLEPNNYYARVSAVDETGETVASVESAVVPLTALTEQLTMTGDSEVVDTVTNTKFSRKFTSIGTFCNGIVLRMATGGSLVGTVRIETDNSGNPSGTLVHANAEITGIDLTDGDVNTPIFFDDEVEWTEGTTLHVVFIPTDGSGSLRGIVTGSTRMCKYYDGTWHDSANLYDLYFKLIGNNKIDWAWDEIDGANSYKLFRTTSTGVYGASCLVQGNILFNSLEDGYDTLLVGTPLGVATCTYEHYHEVEIEIIVPTTATAGAVSCKPEVRYTEGD